MDSFGTDLLFDARQIDQSGIGTYISVQLPRLELILSARRRSLTVLADRDNTPAVSSSTHLVYSAPAKAPVYSVAEQRAWAHALNAVRPRAFWTPHYPFPIALMRPSQRKVLSFITVHDDNHLLPAEISGQGSARRLYARAMLEADARRSHTIFTPSRAAADALAKYVPSAQFVVTPIPVGDAWFEPADPALSPVSGRFILYLGNVKRHKNLPALLEAYTEVEQDIPHTLVIAGSGASVRTLDDRVRTLATALGDRVQMIGRLEFGQLRALVAAAELLVMPSLNEGAGLPPLEAMASGTAVVASAIPSLQETCGDGADYFDPHDHRGLAQLLRTYCLDDAANAGLTARGAAYVAQRQSRIDTDAAANTICSALERH
ncbi:glycosyltransferase family 4 protein [Mycobacterium sp. SMC-4]|uniref:glycosyltransferase family 4 protein n=1 Tax=Mycobacterium sp. SMC-4 TaxID=2857059 RepID=UPI003D01AD28